MRFLLKGLFLIMLAQLPAAASIKPDRPGGQSRDGCPERPVLGRACLSAHENVVTSQMRLVAILKREVCRLRRDLAVRLILLRCNSLVVVVYRQNQDHNPVVTINIPLNGEETVGGLLEGGQLIVDKLNSGELL